MPFLSEAIGEWSLGPYEDHNFDSVSMQQSTVIDSDYVANKIWMHELNHALELDAEGTPRKSVNVQIEVVSKTTVSSDIPRAEAVSTAPSEKEKRNRVVLKYSSLLKKVYTSLSLLIIAAVVVVVVVLSMGNKKENKENKDSEAEAQTTQGIPNQFELIKRANWSNETSAVSIGLEVYKVKRLIIMDTKSEPCYNNTDCIDFIIRRKKVLYFIPLSKDTARMERENFFIAPDGTVYEGRGFHFGAHTYDRQQTNYNHDALGISFIGNYTNLPLTSLQVASFQAFVQGGIDFDRINASYILYHQNQLTLDPNISENVLYRNLQTLNHWKAS